MVKAHLMRVLYWIFVGGYAYVVIVHLVKIPLVLVDIMHQSSGP